MRLPKPQFEVGFVVLFLAMLAAVSLADTWVGLKGPESIASEESHQEMPPRVGQGHSARLRAFARNLQQLESSTEQSSALKQFLRMHVQSQVTHRLGLGNEKVAVTPMGLVFREDLQWVTGPGFLRQNPGFRPNTSMTMGSQSVPHPDPRPAILQFAKDCGERVLILAPIPNKAMFLGKSGEPVNNIDFSRFVAEMRSSGIRVFWPFGADFTGPETGYLRSDTHWDPDFMAAYARSLRDYLIHQGLRQPGGELKYRRQPPRTIENLGDLARMLDLKPGLGAFGKESALIRPVTTMAGQPWQSRPEADLLVLGDSYVNIFSEPGMGWGAHAGLAPTLSYFLQTDLDVIALNGAAPTQTRARLARRDRPLAGKRVVLWFFAVRELAFGNWRPVPLPLAPDDQGSPGLVAKAGDEEVLRVRAKLITPPQTIDPAATPYANALINLKFEVLSVLSGEYGGTELLAQFPLVLDRQRTGAAEMTPGSIVELTLSATAPPDVQNWTLLDDTEAYHLDVWWVLSVL